MTRAGIRGQIEDVTAFYDDPVTGECHLLTLNVRRQQLMHVSGERPKLVEVIRSAEEIKAAKIAR